jgi:hypothetical protein
MVTTVALFGAGAKMGLRLSRNLQASAYRVHHVETGPGGRQRLKDELGIDCLDAAAAMALLDTMREAMDEVVARAAPEIAARDFLLGHMTILSAVIFKQITGQFSDTCNKAITSSKPRLLRDDWKEVSDHDEIAESIRRIT